MSYRKKTGLWIALLVAGLILAGSSCTTAPEAPQVAQIVDTPIPTWTALPTPLPFPLTAQPTPPGTWAGLQFVEYGWELTIHEGLEKRENPLMYAYHHHQEVLKHKDIEGCELSYRLGGRDGYDEGWALLSARKSLGGRDYDVVYVVLQGELIQINYIYDSGIEYSTTVWLSAYHGSLRLRFTPEILGRCVRETEHLLATLDPIGLIHQSLIHADREMRLQSGEYDQEP